jgi:hypothetical protein
MTVITESVLRILIPRRNVHDHLRGTTRQLIRRSIAQIRSQSLHTTAGVAKSRPMTVRA